MLSPSLARPPWADPLTEREVEVLEALVLDETIPETATRIHLSVGTIKLHRQNARIKLGASTTAGALVAAIRWGIVKVPGMEDTVALTVREHLRAALEALDPSAA